MDTNRTIYVGADCSLARASKQAGESQRHPRDVFISTGLGLLATYALQDTLVLGYLADQLIGRMRG